MKKILSVDVYNPQILQMTPLDVEISVEMMVNGTPRTITVKMSPDLTFQRGVRTVYERVARAIADEAGARLAKQMLEQK